MVQVNQYGNGFPYLKPVINIHKEVFVITKDVVTPVVKVVLVSDSHSRQNPFSREKKQRNRQGTKGKSQRPGSKISFYTLMAGYADDPAFTKLA